MGVAVRDEGKKVNSNINVTPMVDVMLVLLIIFMVITPMLQNKVADRHWPRWKIRTAMPDADKEDAIVVAVTRDGAVFLGQNKVDPCQLGSLVRDKLADKTDKMIYVRADARAQYKVVEDAIDDVRTAGVEEVGLLTQRREGNPNRRPVTPARRIVMLNDFEETRSLSHGIFHWRQRRSDGRDQRHAHDRYSSGVADYFHGHRAGYA